MLTRLPRASSLLACIALAACAEAPGFQAYGALDQEAKICGEDPSGEGGWGLPRPGVDLNGVDLNGVDLNGVDLNGVDLNGVDLNGVDLNGVDLNGVDLNGTQLYGVLSDGQVVDLDLSGAIFTGQLANGETASLRVDGVLANPDPANADIKLYWISYQSRDQWLPLCLSGHGHVPVPATLMAGRWDLGHGVPGGGSYIEDDSMFTMACVNSTIAKCAEAGYKPWLGRRDHHQACTRMLRADYCGDGRSFTRNGVWVDFYDGVGIQSDVEPWIFEAEWDESGARCLAETRLRGAHHTPDCAPFLADPACGELTRFGSGTLIMNEHQPRGCAASR